MGSAIASTRRWPASRSKCARIITAKPALVAGFLALIMYVATPTANYYWDGLAFAGKIERVAGTTHSANSLFHQNHLFYNAIGYIFYLVPPVFGITCRALSVLQILSAMSCAVGVGVFFVIARRLSRSLYLAWVGAALLAVSTCWWKAATDADAYSVSVVLVLACAATVLSERPRWYLAGLALAGAMLIHELAALFYPAAIVAVLASGQLENRIKFALKFSALAWGITIAAYYAVAAIVFGIVRPVDVFEWAGSNPYGVKFSNPLTTLNTFPKFQLDVIFGHGFKTFRLYHGAVELVFASIGILALSVAVFVFSRRANVKESFKSIWKVSPEIRGQWRQTMPVLLVWIATYALFLLIWEPYVLHYRVYYVPAAVLMFVLMLSNYHRRTKRLPSGVAAYAVVALFFLNLAFFIAPHMHGSSNLLVAAAKDANRKWDERTVVYFTAGTAIDAAFQYFNQPTEWREATPKAIMRLDDEIEHIYGEGRSVWLNDQAAKSVRTEWLMKHGGGDEIAGSLDGQTFRYLQLQPTR